MIMNSGDVKKFDKKNFMYVKQLGEGGTGTAHLFKDETTNMLFAIKKYAPKDTRFIDDYYKRFVDEIKILFNISHPNIVRVYNYYLYPEEKTGYLQMEFVDGISIDNFEPVPFLGERDWNDIFSEAISAFEYLEQNNILHRDIRPANIMIDKNDRVKVIDFGFGKQIAGTKQEENSVVLNWPVTEMPDEVKLNREYDTRTEIYFVGALFKRLVLRDGGFNFQHIIEKMTKKNPAQRYSSFSEVISDISAGVISELDFSDEEKQIYLDFASMLVRLISSYLNEYSPINNSQVILSNLEDLIRSSALEEYVQVNDKLIGCFVTGRYRYFTGLEMKVKTVVDFYSLATSLTAKRQKILFDNIYNRLSKIEIEVEDVNKEELPF